VEVASREEKKRKGMCRPKQRGCGRSVGSTVTKGPRETYAEKKGDAAKEETCPKKAKSALARKRERSTRKDSDISNRGKD